MIDPVVSDLIITEQQRFTRSREGTVTVHVARFYVGQHGPLYVELGAGEFTAAKMEAAINAKVATLREMGAIK